MTDWQLLRAYAENGSDSAFATLAKRHVDMVHAAAARQMHDPHLAEDVTQAVFILLARKASSLRSSVVLAGWLYRTTSHVASRALRDRIRQKRRAEEAATMNLNEPAEEIWGKLAPHLDGAISALNAADRDAVVLRFLQHRSFREVAGVLGVSEDAAKKRVARALEKLRTQLTARGIAASAVALGGVLLSRPAAAAPANVIAAAAAAGAAGAGTASALTLAGLIAREWLLVKLKWAGAGIGAAALVLLFIANSVLHKALRPETESPTGAPSLATVETPRAQRPVVDGKVAVARPGNPRTIRLRVLSATDNSPLVGALVRVTHYGAKYINEKLTADATGQVEITRPERRFEGMAFFIAAAAHVPKCLSWNREEELSLPAEYVVKLDPGVRASGRVMNESGQAVAGATLSFNGEGMKWNARDYVDYRYLHVTPTTEADGGWAVDFLSPQPTVWGYVKHPDYAETEFKFALGRTGITDVTIVIKRGAAVSGLVGRTDGGPVTNAQVTADWEHSRQAGVQTKCDANGHFTLPNVTIGRFRLKVAAEGFHDFEKWFGLPNEGLNVTVALTPKKIVGNSTLRGRVVDEAGTALAGISISLAQPQPGLEGVDWSATTDDEGRFVWDHAPEGSVRFNFSSWSYEHRDDIELASGDAEHIVKLKARKTSQVRCVVNDANTGGAIPIFKVMTGTRRTLPGGKEFDDLRFAGEGRDGEFVFRWRAERPFMSGPFGESPMLRVEAEGYTAETVSLSAALDGDATITIVLEAATDIQGLVLTPQRTPADGAQVTLLGPRLGATMQQPARLLLHPQDSRYRNTTTRSDGSFTLSPIKEAEQLLAVHDDGWAIIPLNGFAGGNVQLRPWGRIEGVLYIGRNPGANQPIMATSGYRQADTISFSYNTKTDSEGRFVLDKVPPGRVEVGRLMLTPFSQDGSGYTAQTQQKQVEVSAGETARVTLGGTGVRVRGRLVMDSPREDVVFELPAQNLRPAQLQPDPMKPPQGYGFFCQPDGSFVVEDIPAGSYVLEARLNAVKDRNNPEAGLSGFPVGERKLEVIIPESQQEEFDLGDIVIAVKQDKLPLGVR